MSRLTQHLLTLSTAGLLTLSLAGCKGKAADDATLAKTIQAQLAGDSVLAGQQLNASVTGGVATLSGNVANDAQRSVAARDAAGVPGIKEVVDNVIIGPVAATVTTPAPGPIGAPPAPAETAQIPRETVATRRQQAPLPPPNFDRRPAPVERFDADRQRDQSRSSSQGQSQAFSQQNQPAPFQQPPPPQPTFRNLTIPAGANLNVRVTQTLDSASTQQGASFSGVTSSDILVDGLVAIPSGSAVSGTVDNVQEAAHFKGSSLLTVSLSTLRRRGETLSIATDPYTVKGKGRGENTAIKTGGGAAVGAVLGGIFGGGKGAAIGAGAGGGLGAGSNAITRGQQVQIPSESIVIFRLTTPVSVRVRTDAGAHDGNGDPNLQRRNGNPNNFPGNNNSPQ